MRLRVSAVFLPHFRSSENGKYSAAVAITSWLTDAAYPLRVRTVFLHFRNFELEQKSCLRLLAELCGVALGFYSAAVSAAGGAAAKNVSPSISRRCRRPAKDSQDKMVRTILSGNRMILPVYREKRQMSSRGLSANRQQPCFLTATGAEFTETQQRKQALFWKIIQKIRIP